MSELGAEEKIAFVQRATREIAGHTFPFIASVAAVESASSGFGIGTAIRIRDGARRWIVTAAHVIEQGLRTTGRIAVTAVRGEPPIELNSPSVTDRECDVCAYAVGVDFPDVAFWDLEARDEDPAAISRDFLVAHGFPQVRSRFSPGLDALVARSLPYGAMSREEALPDDVAPHQFALEFAASTLKTVDGDVAEAERPNGLSGSGVWRIGATGGSASAWSPGRCRLVGILTQWRPRDEILVATRIVRVVELVRRG